MDLVDVTGKPEQEAFLRRLQAFAAPSCGTAVRSWTTRTCWMWLTRCMPRSGTPGAGSSLDPVSLRQAATIARPPR